MNPTGAPEPPGDSGRIVRGIFVLPAGAREHTNGRSPRAPGRFGQNRLGGFLCCQWGSFFVLRWSFVDQGVVVQPRRIFSCSERLGERELVDPGVGARLKGPSMARGG